MTRKTKRLCKGALAGLAGGLAGSIALTQFQNLWTRLAPPSGGSHGDPATVKAARSLFPFPENRKKAAGNLLHYSFGTLNGAAYGAAAEVSPSVAACRGTLFGATLFAVADEALVPAFGWSKPPNAYPLSAHVYGFASHLVDGAATDAVRRMVRHVIR